MARLMLCRSKAVSTGDPVNEAAYELQYKAAKAVQLTVQTQNRQKQTERLHSWWAGQREM